MSHAVSQYDAALAVRYMVVWRSPALRVTFLNTTPKSSAFPVVWGSIDQCTRFDDPADAVAMALALDAEVAWVQVVLGVTHWGWA